MKLAMSTKQAYSEINQIINLLDDVDREKIPQKLRDFFEEEQDSNYDKELTLSMPLKEQITNEETIALFAMLYLKYICTDEEEKKILSQKLKENEEKYQEELREKYNIDKMFKKK